MPIIFCSATVAAQARALMPLTAEARDPGGAFREEVGKMGWTALRWSAMEC